MSELLAGTGVYVDADGLFRYDGIINGDTFDTVAGRIGRNHGSALLSNLYDCGSLDLAHPGMAGAVADVWSIAEYPQDSLGDDYWVRLFSENGYSHDGVASHRPHEAVTVYRGCPSHLRFRMSWTSSLYMAQRFARGGLLGRPPGQVYVHLAEPHELLAYIDAEGRGENEYVLDPQYLKDNNVVEYQAPPVLPPTVKVSDRLRAVRAMTKAQGQN